MMIAHGLFPILVGQFKYPTHKKFKKNFNKTAIKYFNEIGKSDEMTGHVDMHHVSEFSDLYKFLSECTEQYLKTLSIDDDIFDINFVKSWFNVTRSEINPMHAHGDAQLSITYYVNTPDDCKRMIRFYNYYDRKEPFSGCIKHNNSSENWNIFNSYNWSFEVSEGDVFIFPSTLVHDTIGEQSDRSAVIKSSEDLETCRVCIASDVVLTYRKKQAKALGLQPIKNWRTFQK